MNSCLSKLETCPHCSPTVSWDWPSTDWRLSIGWIGAVRIQTFSKEHHIFVIRRLWPSTLVVLQQLCNIWIAVNLNWSQIESQILQCLPHSVEFIHWKEKRHSLVWLILGHITLASRRPLKPLQQRSLVVTTEALRLWWIKLFRNIHEVLFHSFQRFAVWHEVFISAVCVIVALLLNTQTHLSPTSKEDVRSGFHLRWEQLQRLCQCLVFRNLLLTFHLLHSTTTQRQTKTDWLKRTAGFPASLWLCVVGEQVRQRKTQSSWQ